MQTQQRLQNLVIHILFILLSLAILVPFLLIAAISFSSEHSLVMNGYRFWPDQFSLQAYRYLFLSPTILLRAYGVTIAVSVIGTLCALLLTSLIAYPISRPDYEWRGKITFYIFFTMLFSGGLIPFYILMTQYLHVQDTLLALILPGLLSPFYVIVMKGFFSKIPMELIESVKMDGAGEWRIFYTIILPLSAPSLATIGLFISFNYWNDWFNALLFINTEKLVPLQLLLVRMMNTIDFLTSNSRFTSGLRIDLSQFPSLSARMAMVVLAAGPMMFVFPFFQKYFVQGLTIGALKG